jgi:hypothetical protein
MREKNGTAKAEWKRFNHGVHREIQRIRASPENRGEEV